MTEIRNERLRTLKAKAEAAGRKFEDGRKRLYQADGSPLFAEDVMKLELEKLARERNGEIFAVEEEVREIAAGAGDTLERLENADPADLLSAEELERAERRRAFALDQAEGLSVEDLKKRLESVLAGGDRANIFAHLVAGRRRQQAIIERRQERERAEVGQSGTAVPPSYTSGTPLDDTLEAMQKALAGQKRAAELEAAAALGRESFEVESVAHSLRHGGRSGVYSPDYAVPGVSREQAQEAERMARIR